MDKELRNICVAKHNLRDIVNTLGKFDSKKEILTLIRKDSVMSNILEDKSDEECVTTLEGLLGSISDKIKAKWQQLKEAKKKRAEENKKKHEDRRKEIERENKLSQMSEEEVEWYECMIETGVESKIIAGELDKFKNDKIVGVSLTSVKEWADEVKRICDLLIRVSKSDEFVTLEYEEFEDWFEKQIKQLRLKLITNTADFQGSSIYDASIKETIGRLGYNDIETLKKIIELLRQSSEYGTDISTVFNDEGEGNPNSPILLQFAQRNPDNHDSARERIGAFMYEYHWQHFYHDIWKLVYSPILIRLMDTEDYNDVVKRYFG